MYIPLCKEKKKAGAKAARQPKRAEKHGSVPAIFKQAPDRSSSQRPLWMGIESSGKIDYNARERPMQKSRPSLLAGVNFSLASSHTVQRSADPSHPFTAKAKDEESILPGMTGPGAYAGESIAARSKEQSFTSGEREQINAIGKSTGCHSCGNKDPGTKSGDFIPDHQPVSKLVPDGTPQRLYPHCLHCSKVQGGTVAKILRARKK